MSFGQEKTEESGKPPRAPKLVGARGWAGGWQTERRVHLGAGMKVRGALEVWRDLTVLESGILTNGQGEMGQNETNCWLTPIPAGAHAIAKDGQDRPQSWRE